MIPEKPAAYKNLRRLKFHFLQFRFQSKLEHRELTLERLQVSSESKRMIYAHYYSLPFHPVRKYGRNAKQIGTKSDGNRRKQLRRSSLSRSWTKITDWFIIYAYGSRTIVHIEQARTPKWRFFLLRGVNWQHSILISDDWFRPFRLNNHPFNSFRRTYNRIAISTERSCFVVLCREIL